MVQPVKYNFAQWNIVYLLICDKCDTEKKKKKK